MGLPEPTVNDQFRAGLLYDVGKPGISNRILDKPGRLTVADIFDALASDRPYRAGIPMEKVLGVLNEESGEKLCPESVAAVNELVSEGRLSTHYE